MRTVIEYLVLVVTESCTLVSIARQFDINTTKIEILNFITNEIIQTNIFMHFFLRFLKKSWTRVNC